MRADLIQSLLRLKLRDHWRASRENNFGEPGDGALEQEGNVADAFRLYIEHQITVGAD